MFKQLIEYSKREAFDELYTPPEAIEPLLKYIPDSVKKIWCCCDDSESNIVKRLREKEYTVIATHLNDGIDALDSKIGCDMIITNPPYSLKDEFLEWAYNNKIPFAFLLPTTAISGKKRNNFYRKYGINLIVLDKRIDFNGKGSCWFPVAWFFYSGQNDSKLYFEEIK